MAKVFALLVIASSLIACEAQVVPPDDAKVEAKFPISAHPEGTGATGLDIYIDGSMSMRGYVTLQDSNFRHAVREIVESASIAQFDLKIYKFAANVSAVTRLPLSQLESPGFYDGRDTPLAAILNRLAETPNRAGIIISDLVQSQSGTDGLVLAQALSHLAGRVHEMKLLAYRSSFDGNYYSESRHGPPQKLTVNQSLPGSGRPFYVLVIAPNTQAMKRIDSYLLSRVPPVQTISATGPAVVVDEVELATRSIKEQAWRLYKPATLRDNDAVRRITSAFRLTKGTDLQAVLPLDFKMHVNIPVRNPGQLNCEGTMVRWRGADRFDQVSQVELPVSGSFSNDRKVLQMQLTVHRPEPGTWDIYLIKIRPGQGNLDVPDWVNAWSTDDDSSVAKGNRTFQLKLIVQSMINAISENSVFLEYVLEVGR